MIFTRSERNVSSSRNVPVGTISRSALLMPAPMPGEIGAALDEIGDAFTDGLDRVRRPAIGLHLGQVCALPGEQLRRMVSWRAISAFLSAGA